MNLVQTNQPPVPRKYRQNEIECTWYVRYTDQQLDSFYKTTKLSNIINQYLQNRQKITHFETIKSLTEGNVT